MNVLAASKQKAETTGRLELEIGRYRLWISPASALVPNRFLGSAWRGVLGWELKRLVCTVRRDVCPGCMLYYTCVYSYIFETPPPPHSEKMRKYIAAPHPFILAPGEAVDGRYPLELTLVGRANSMVGYLVQAISRAGRTGLRPLQQPFGIAAVEQEGHVGGGDWRPIFEENRLLPGPPSVPPAPVPPPRLRVILITPLRLRRMETHVRPDNFRFSDLFSNLLRRVSLLSYFHGQAPLETDFAGLVARSRAVELHRADLRWEELARYSRRQHARLLTGGLLGEFELDSDQLGEMWEYLWLGQFIHAGKGATMGLGRYAITAA
jgi:CRISPR/Cas system endoribonuclease Cas6 (RAMP superfamily)